MSETTPLLIYKEESHRQIKNARRSLCTVSVILFDFKHNRNLSANYCKNYKYEIHEKFLTWELLCFYVAMLLCCYVAILICCYVAMLLC